VRQITVLNLGRHFPVSHDDWSLLCSRIEQLLAPQARIAAPGSELATWDWLCCHSALGELLDVDFEGLSHMRLYRASDLLTKHRAAIESHVFGALTSLFSLTDTVTLYDLTNTYFEGQAANNPKAKFGRSKEKRSDCPLVTLGLVLDGSGFVRRSKTFEGNVSEGTTLQVMLADLAAPNGALVIMDAGIATQDNIDWLIENKYRYLGGCRTFGIEAKFDPSEGSFCRICWLIAVAMGQKDGKK